MIAKRSTDAAYENATDVFSHSGGVPGMITRSVIFDVAPFVAWLSGAEFSGGVALGSGEPSYGFPAKSVLGQLQKA
jgi:hypothetical protein